MDLLLAPSLCYRCGSQDVIRVTDDYAVCEPCDDSFAAFMAATYPYGQCWACRAEGYVRSNGTIVTGGEAGPHHAEGGCSQWTDYVPELEDFDEAYRDVSDDMAYMARVY